MSDERRPAATPASSPAQEATRLLLLGRDDRAAARARLRELEPVELARLVQDLRPSVRPELLMLMDRPEDVVPLLPELELVTTVRASGMSEAAWLLEIATPEQRVACIDLDCWKTYELEPQRLGEWVDALIEAGRPTLLRALLELDPEVWVLGVQRMTDMVVVGKEDDPPDGCFSEDGVVYWRPRSDEDFARIKAIAQELAGNATRRYWQLVYGMLFESAAECEEFALKWRRARMNDLGFPDLELAMQAYKPLSPDAPAVWETDLADAPRSSALAPAPRLPDQMRGTLLARALAELSPARAADVLGYVLAAVNSVAVADGLRLSEPDSIPQALAKAVRGIDRGLEARARALGQPAHVVLDTTSPLDLFRIGATEDPALARPVPDEPYDDEDEDQDEEDEA